MNILLNDTERKTYEKSIKELVKLCPETTSRKMERANVQQAFILSKVKELTDTQGEILCVGSYEDSASEALSKLGYNVFNIDPLINATLDQFFKSTDRKFDIIFCTSVLEHVQDDELFIEQVCKLLKPNGYGIITCDFNDGYGKVITPKPKEDFRLYTKDDLLIRLGKVLKDNNCEMFGDINYDATPDFQYEGCTYSFATYVFTKKEAAAPAPKPAKATTTN